MKSDSSSKIIRWWHKISIIFANLIAYSCSSTIQIRKLNSIKSRAILLARIDFPIGFDLACECVCVCFVSVSTYICIFLLKPFHFQDVAAVVGVQSHVHPINKRLDFVHILLRSILFLALSSHLHFLCAVCRTKQSIRPLKFNFLTAHRHKLYASSYSACAYILGDFVLLSMPIGFNSCCHCESFVITMCVCVCVSGSGSVY